MSRRGFLGAAGVAGGTAAIAGVPRTAGATQATTISWAADSIAKENQAAINQALHDAGLSEDIRLEVLAGAWETGQRRDQYQRWLSSGRVTPDILNLDNGWHQPFIVRDQVANLSDLLSSDVINTVEEEYQERAVASARGPEGDLYGVPLYITLATIQYRKDLVEEAGYDPAGNNWATESMTWQRFAEIVADVQEQAGLDYGFSFQADAYEGLACCDFNEHMSSWGGAYFGPLENLFGPVGERPITVDEEPVLNALRMLRTFIHGGDDQHALDGYTGNISPQAVLQWTEETSRRPFTNGNAVALRNWGYSIRINGSEENFGEDMGVMPIPYAVTPEEAQYEGTGGPVSALGGWNLAANPNSNKLDAVREVMTAITRDQFQIDLFRIAGFTMPKTDLITSDAASEVPIVGRYLNSIQVAGENAIPRPATAIWPQESTRISQAVHGVMSQDQAPEPAMNRLGQQLESIEESV